MWQIDENWNKFMAAKNSINFNFEQLLILRDFYKFCTEEENTWIFIELSPYPH
ncbi:MAG: hypothetical protein ACI85O_000114 [Saprospiraceae bacterium]